MIDRKINRSAFGVGVAARQAAAHAAARAAAGKHRAAATDESVEIRAIRK